MNKEVRKNDIWLRNISVAVIVSNLLYFYFPFPPIVLRIILIGLCLYIYCRKDYYLSAIEKWMMTLCGLNILYYFLDFLNPGSPSMTSVGNNLCAFLPICLFSYLTEKKVMTEKFISIMIVLLILSSIGYYVHFEQLRLQSLNLEDGDSATINASTVFLMLIPLLFYEKRQTLAYIEMAICIFFLVSAVKRGNIVAAILPVLIFLYYHYKQSKRNALRLLILLFFVVIGTYLLNELVTSNYYFQRRYEDTLDGYLSNRDRIYYDSFHLWYNADFFQLLFGNGFRSVTHYLGTPAHSDWLEILVDNGIIGIIIYIGVFVSLLKIIINCKSIPERQILFSAFLAWGAKSVYSMAYVENYMSLLMISIGIAITKSKIKNQSLNIR